MTRESSDMEFHAAFGDRVQWTQAWRVHVHKTVDQWLRRKPSWEPTGDRFFPHEIGRIITADLMEDILGCGVTEYRHGRWYRSTPLFIVTPFLQPNNLRRTVRECVISDLTNTPSIPEGMAVFGLRKPNSDIFFSGSLNPDFKVDVALLFSPYTRQPPEFGYCAMECRRHVHDRLERPYFGSSGWFSERRSLPGSLSHVGHDRIDLSSLIISATEPCTMSQNVDVWSVIRASPGTVW